MVCNLIPFCNPHESIIDLMIIIIGYKFNGCIFEDQNKTNSSHNRRQYNDVNDNEPPVIDEIKGNRISCDADSERYAD
jgi:hypothetical protein